MGLRKWASRSTSADQGSRPTMPMWRASTPLCDWSVLGSPFFYLLPGVVQVQEPVPAQARMTGQTRLHVSTTVRTHSRRPSNSSSCTNPSPRPGSVRVRCCDHRGAWPSPAGAAVEPHLQAFQSIEPMNTLHVHLPALPPQQYRDPPVAVTHVALGDLADALPQGRLLGSAGTIVDRLLTLVSRV